MHYGITPGDQSNGTSGGDDFTVEKSRIHHSYTGVRFEYASGFTGSEGVHSNSIYNNVSDGISSGASSGNSATGNRLYNNGASGITFEGDCTLTGNYAYSNAAEGIRPESNCLVSGNYAYNNTDDGIAISDNGIVSTNYSFGNRVNGFVLDYPSGTLIVSNESYANDNDGFNGNGASPNMIVANRSYGNTAGGFWFYESTPNIIALNQVYSNTLQGIGIGAGIGGQYQYLTSNQVYSNGTYGLQFGVNGASTGSLSIYDNFGGSGANATADILLDNGRANTLSLYGTTLASTTEVTSTSTSGAFVASFKHDGTNGSTKIWNDYVIPDNKAETPNNEGLRQFNYANALFPDSFTEHWFASNTAGTEDTDIQLTFNGAMIGANNAYAYYIRCKATTCATGGSNDWDVYRDGVDVGDASTNSQYTDATTNVQFTIQDVGTDYNIGSAYMFIAFKSAGDTNVQKTVTMMTDADTFTVGSGETLEMKGQSAGVNVTNVDRGATGGYQITVASGGTIDANAYYLNHLGGAGQASGLVLASGAVITNLANGAFDNYGTNVGTADSFINVASSIISSGTPSATFAGLSFVNTGGFANCNLNATGTDAAGYWRLPGSTGAFAGETNDCNDGAADGTPGQIDWSSLLISGFAYEDDATTKLTACNGSTAMLVVYDGTSTSAAVTCNASTGAFSISSANAPAAGTPLILWIDGATCGANNVSGSCATTAIRYSGSGDITDAILRRNRLIVRHDDASAITNTNLDSRDNGNDTDIVYSVTSSNLTVEDQIKLVVNSGDTFTPGGTITMSPSSSASAADGDVLIQSTATLDMAANALSIGGDYTNSGTFTNSANQVTTFTATATGHTLSGTLNGSSDFEKVTFNGASGGWTIADPMLVSTANATNTFNVTNGTVTLGDGSGDNLDVRGRFTVSSGATFQSKQDLAQGSTITIDMNANSSTPTCSNCYVDVSGTFDIGKNVILRLNPRSTATASDTTVQVANSGTFEVQGTQDVTGTLTAADSLALRETTLCSTQTYANDAHNNKNVRISSGLAIGMIYDIADTIADDPNCLSNTDDSLIIADGSSATDAAPDVVVGAACAGSSTCTINVADSLIAANNEGIGRYVHNLTDDKYYRLVDSVESGQDTLKIITNAPDDFTTMGDGDDIEITDGFKTGDTFEVLDYAYVTASADGGRTWDILTGSHTSQENPLGNSYGPGYTGTSGGGNEPQWGEETVDLSPYAGKQALLRFEYITDEAVNTDGFAIDDIQVPEAGFSDDAEQETGWDARGFVRTGNQIPQPYLVQVIEIEASGAMTVRAMDLDASQRGSLTVCCFGQKVERAIVAVSGMAPVTTQPAPFRLTVKVSP